MRAILHVFSGSMSANLVMGVVAMLLIRFLPPGEYATYTLALAAVTVVSKVVASSFNRIYIVGTDAPGAPASPAPFLSLQLVFLAVLALATFPFFHELGAVYAWVAALGTATVLSEFSKTFFQRDLRFRRYAAVDVGLSLANLAAVGTFVLALGTAVRAWQVLAVRAGALVAVFLLVMAPRLAWREMLHVGRARKLAGAILRTEHKYFFLYTALLGVFSQIDVFSLQAFSTELQLATYGSAFRYYALLLVALNSLQAVQMPVLQAAATRADADAVFRTNRKLLLALVPVVAVGMWLSGWIIPWVDGGKYPDAVPAFRILAISALLSLGLSVYSPVLLRFRKIRFLFVSAVAATVVAAGAHAYLAGAYGARGAAVGTLLSFLVLNGAIAWRARRLLDEFPATAPVPDQAPAGEDAIPLAAAPAS